MADIDGTSGNDSLNGTSSADISNGGAGKNTQDGTLAKASIRKRAPWSQMIAQTAFDPLQSIAAPKSANCKIRRCDSPQSGVLKMADIFVPIGGGSFTASPGDNFIIPDGMTGNLFIDGATSFTVQIDNNLTGSGGGNLANITFGSDTEPTVNIAPGVDTSPYAIDANGENLTVNIGDGATVGNIDGSNLDATGSFNVVAGSTIKVQGSVDNLGPADANISFGDDANISGSVEGSSGGSARDQCLGGLAFHFGLRGRANRKFAGLPCVALADRQ